MAVLTTDAKSENKSSINKDKSIKAYRSLNQVQNDSMQII